MASNLNENIEDELKCCTFRVPANIVLVTSNSPSRLEVTMQQEGNINEDTGTRFKCDVKTPCQCGVVVRYIRLLIEPSENVAQVELKFSTGTTGDENIDEDTEIIEYEDKDKDEEDEGCEEENPEPPLGQWSQEDYNNKDEEDSDTSSSISVIYGIGGS